MKIFIIIAGYACASVQHRDEAPRVLELLSSSPGLVTAQLWGLEELLTLSVSIPLFYRDMKTELNNYCSFMT